MNSTEFDKIVNDTCESIKKVLSSKAKEYAKGDRLYNFKRAAEINHTTPELALAGMLVKHWVSVLDLIEGTLENTEAMVNEKIGDTINYLILLKAILREKRIDFINPCEDAEHPLVSGHGVAFAEMVKAATEQAEKIVTDPEKGWTVIVTETTGVKWLLINTPVPYEEAYNDMLEYVLSGDDCQVIEISRFKPAFREAKMETPPVEEYVEFYRTYFSKHPTTPPVKGKPYMVINTYKGKISPIIGMSLDIDMAKAWHSALRDRVKGRCMVVPTEFVKSCSNQR